MPVESIPVTCKHSWSAARTVAVLLAAKERPDRNEARNLFVVDDFELGDGSAINRKHSSIHAR